MTIKRRSITPTFKQEAACLVLDQSCSVAEAGRSVNVGENALRRWVKQLSEERGGVAPTSKAMTPGLGTGSPLRALGAGEIYTQKATALLISDEMNRTR